MVDVMDLNHMTAIVIGPKVIEPGFSANNIGAVLRLCLKEAGFAADDMTVGFVSTVDDVGPVHVHVVGRQHFPTKAGTVHPFPRAFDLAERKLKAKIGRKTIFHWQEITSGHFPGYGIAPGCDKLEISRQQ